MFPNCAAVMLAEWKALKTVYFWQHPPNSTLLRRDLIGGLSTYKPQVPRGLLLALILLRNVLLTSCLAENQLTSTAITECRKTSGLSPGHLICSWADRNYSLLAGQCGFFFFLFHCIQKMSSWPSHPDEPTVLVLLVTFLSDPSSRCAHVSSAPFFVLFCITLNWGTKERALEGSGSSNPTLRPVCLSLNVEWRTDRI